MDNKLKKLGSVVTSDGYCEKDIRSRIAIEKNTFLDKRKLLSHNMSLYM